jgi:acetylornithine/succinyldiaminopimelate/putrescine aminotransferase
MHLSLLGYHRFNNLATKTIAEGLSSPAQVNTYGGQAVTCAAGLVSFDIIKNERPVE